MNIKLLLLFLLVFGTVPNLGFFTLPSFFVIAFIAIMLLLFFIFTKLSAIKKFDNSYYKLSPLYFFILLFYAAIYYGGLYQNKDSFIIGYLILFTLICYAFINILTNKKISIKVVFISYIILAIWTLISSPHPIVDTMPAFTEAPLKFIKGINPYDTTYTKIYPNIDPDYYNHFPFSFIYPLPFVLIFGDPRYSLIFANLLSALLIYKLANKYQPKYAAFLVLVYLLLPRSFYMLEHMYLDQIVFTFYLLFIYLFVFSKKWISFIFLAITCLFKQHILLLLPLFFKQKKNIFLLKNWRYSLSFLIPFLVPLYYLLINPQAFLKNTLFGLSSSNITSPINISLTLPTFLKTLNNNLTVLNKPYILIISIIFLLIFFLIFRAKLSLTYKLAASIFFFNFIFYHAFFNSYYLVILLLYLGICLDYWRHDVKSRSELADF